MGVGFPVGRKLLRFYSNLRGTKLLRFYTNFQAELLQIPKFARRAHVLSRAMAHRTCAPVVMQGEVKTGNKAWAVAAAAAPCGDRAQVQPCLENV